MKGKKREFDLDVSDWMWDVVERLKQQTGAVGDVLSVMSQKDLKRFYRECEEATEELIPHERDAKRGLDAEDLHELAAWVVSQGKDYYRKVWDDLALLPTSTKAVKLCNWAAVAANLYEERFGEELF